MKDAVTILTERNEALEKDHAAVMLKLAMMEERAQMAEARLNEIGFHFSALKQLLNEID